MYSKTRPVLQNISIITEGDSKRISERQKRKEKYWKEITTIKLNVKIFLKSLLKISKGHAFPLDRKNLVRPPDLPKFYLKLYDEDFSGRSSR